MRFRRLRTRIIVFFISLLVGVQVLGLILVNSANTLNAEKKTADEFAVGQRVFERLLQQNRDRLTQAARVLAADYGFREAVASHDVGTITSVLNNHGSRIKADVMTLASVDGALIADTLSAQQHNDAFRFAHLIEQARANNGASAIEMVDGRAYQMVVVPVLAPLPIAWVAVGFVVDDALAMQLQQLTTLQVSFLSIDQTNKWQLLASTLHDETRGSLATQFPALQQALLLTRLDTDGQAQLLRVFKLEEHDNLTIVAVLQRSTADAFAAFAELQHTLVLLGLAGLLVTIIGSAVIALNITRPLSALAKAATRMEAGDYSNAVALGRKDEIGVLANSLDKMRTGIADREQEILRLAYRDTLTDLPNRALFNERLKQAIAHARDTGEQVVILMMDLDRFKYVNDTLGHGVGDHVLHAVAERLLLLLEPDDIMARLGGDEFAVLLNNSDLKQAALTAQRVVSALEQPIIYQDQPLDVGTSIGIARFPEHGRDASVLLRNADIAMYVAKRNKSGSAIYDPEYDTHQQEHLSLLGELRRAVEHNELKLFYQPKVSLLNAEVGAVEALLRWDHPVRGVVSPAEFIPFAEQTGYIKVLTRWVLAEALRQCGVWNASGMPLRVSVNISARDLMNRELPEQIGDLMTRHKVPADLLCLEITESGFMEDPAHAQKVLQRLSLLGIHLSIDDYGTGYSSLSYIVQLPVDELKIDRSFVMRMNTDQQTSTIVRSTIELGHSLGLKVVAEGVEDEAGMKMLKELGCDQAQGYFISKPISAAQLEAWLLKRRADETAELATSAMVRQLTEHEVLGMLNPPAKAG